MNKVLEEISKIGIVPVIALDHVEDEMCIRDRHSTASIHLV